MPSAHSPTSNPSFVHLQVHSEYSLVDGLVRVEDLVQSAVDLGYHSVALTDLCNLFGVIKFYRAAEAAGIKPIIGIDAWVQADTAEPNTAQNATRLLLLCQNEQGYRNLIELISRAYTEGQADTTSAIDLKSASVSVKPAKGKTTAKAGHSALMPCIHQSWLRASSVGLIAIAPAYHSDIAEALLSGQAAQAEILAADWMRIFPDRFYLALTRIGRADEALYETGALQLSIKQSLPLVATHAVCFSKPDDFEAHEARVCIHEGSFLNDPRRTRRYQEAQFFTSPEAMQDLFADLPEALENSLEIALRCTVRFNLTSVHLPDFPVPEGQTIEQHLEVAARAGLSARFADRTVSKEHWARLESEISVLNQMGYAGYFLIVADFVQWAKHHQIPVGPGRGSGVGSLTAYALGITGLDPLAYDLLFERFLTLERVSMPDFDIDFCIDGRDRVIDYVARTYGRASVSQIITYGTMAARAVLRDVGRVLGHPYGFVDKIAKLIPHELGITLNKALVDEPLLKQRYDQEEEVKSFIDLAQKLEGIVRNAGKHAGGVVIAPSKLTDFTPLYCDADGSLLTQFDKDDVESIGLVKFDFLGLRTLTVIHHAMIAVNDYRASLDQKPINIEEIPLNDPAVFDLLGACQTTAIFQLESRGMKDLLRRLKPDHFEEIIALGALFRPGPLQSGMVDDFINRKHGRAQPEYWHPNLVSVLKPTYGVILYQEQVMQIAQILSGYTLGSADILRRAMGKKKPEEMAKQRVIFLNGALAHGIEPGLAASIFDLMEKFAGYGFNKSHAAAYALITYQTAWLKSHYPQEYMAAVLSSEMAQTDKIMFLIEECRSLKIGLVPPDVNHSHYAFSVDAEKRIVYGLGAIKGVGEAVVQSIVQARNAGPFKDLYDFCTRVDSHKMSARVLEILIKAGALDSFGLERASLMALLEPTLASVQQWIKQRVLGQADLFGDRSFQEHRQPARVSALPWSEAERLLFEKQSLGLYLSGHPLAAYRDRLEHVRSSTLSELSPSQGTQTLVGILVGLRTLLTRKGDKMAFLSLEDETGRQDLVLFSDAYQAYRELLIKDQILVLRVEVGHDHFSGGLRVRCLEIKDFEQAMLGTVKALRVQLNTDFLAQTLVQDLAQTLRPYQEARGCPVLIDYPVDGAWLPLKCGADWRVHPRQKLIEALQAMQAVKQVDLAF